MEAGLRRVRKLRLRSSDESLNRRGAILVEDAMRTASLPDGDSSRLLIIRELSLGRIRAGDSPSTIAMRIEERCRRLGFDAVYAISDAASSTDAVYFKDDLEPCVALALKIARGQIASEWFWPLAIPSWNAALTRAEQMRAILAAALASGAGAAAALVLLRYLIRAGAVAPMLSAIRSQDGSALMRAFDWSTPRAPDDADSPGHRTMSQNSPPSTFVHIAQPWFAQWGASDSRSLWLACALLAIERPALAALPDLSQRAAEFIDATHRSEPGTARDDRTRSATIESDSAPELFQADAGDDSLPVEIRQSAEIFRELSAEKTSGVSTGDVAHDQSIDRQVPAARSERQFTMCGGLFFLVAVMERLGIARWLELFPVAREFGLPALVLKTIAVDLGCAPDDPVLEALGPPADDLPEPVRTMARSWTRWIRRYLRYRVHLSLTRLVYRPGRVAFTDINIDVMFRFDRADIRVRRAGLDIDPGWTPWLGRVVRFRYVGDEIYDA